ncbi:MAG: chemotaxis protein CheC [Actinobacteria bacterium]|nr:chemotaxis protein CheC [Actinomycetota bacterium]MDI6830772.1 chemotaxis protein CheC [Actinomycetota bacterium]
MAERRGLTPLQLDALREVGNIGSGNAAVALSTMVDKKVLLSVPRATLVPLVRVSDLVGGAETPVVGIYLHISGEASGSMLLLLEEHSANQLAHLMVSGSEAGELSTMEQSALQETGSILAGSYLNALSQMTGILLRPSVPGFAMDMAGAIIDFILVEISQSEDYVLVIETEFDILEHVIKGHLILFPDLGSLDLILGRLGVSG